LSECGVYDIAQPAAIFYRRSLELDAITIRGRFKRRVRNNIPIVIYAEDSPARAVRELFLLVLLRLVVSSGLDEFDLVRKRDEAHDDGCVPFVEVQELYDSLVDLLLYAAVMVHEPPNKSACLLQRVRFTHDPPLISFGRGI